MPMMTRLALLCLLAVPACRSRTADLGMSDSAFVQVMSELKEVADAPSLTSEVRAQRRDAVLRNRKVSAEKLESLSSELTAHPQHAKRLWAAIELKASRPLQIKR